MCRDVLYPAKLWIACLTPSFEALTVMLGAKKGSLTCLLQSIICKLCLANVLGAMNYTASQGSIVWC